MSRTAAVILLMQMVTSAKAQSTTATETVRNYSIAQKRLLVTNTAQFANCITQNILDQDSIINMASSINGMPFLLPYNETFPGGRVTIVSQLINSRRIHEAKAIVDQAIGDMRIQGLLEIALWYLHQDGTHSNDLDSASRFIQLALTLSNAAGGGVWKNECILQSAELQYQQGNKQSNLVFSRLAATALQAGKAEIAALAYMRMADLLLPTDTSKENLYYKSLDIYRSLALKEKQIDLLWKIEFCHEHLGFSLAKKDLQEIINISNNIGFKHTLYAQNRLAYVLINTGDYLGAMENARAALENMNWSGISEVQGTFYIRMGVAYSMLGKYDEFLQWLNKALVTGTKKTHLFWYKSLLILAPFICYEMNKPAESLSLIDSITRIFPPLTVWEKMQLLSSVGYCYDQMKKQTLADTYFRQLLEMANANPLADPYGEMSGEYISISQSYLSKGNMKMARVFLEKGRLKERNDVGSLSYLYSLYYKIDSIEGNYKSALQNRIKYKDYFDSSISMDQRKKMDELIVKYAAEKKDQDIKLLKQQGIVRQIKLKQDAQIQKLMVAGTALLVIIVGMLFSQFKFKQRSNAAMTVKNGTLQHLLDEKEWLLKEVHHRVKNNLHTVISLLESQAAYLQDDALKAVENTQHRIFAMSLIHQKLYQGEDLKTIDMSVYLPEFIDYLSESFGTFHHIHFQLTIEPVKLTVTQAVPIALIINEAVTNAIKYAFPNKRKGNILVTLHKDDGLITLLIADNGIGIDESLRNGASESMGLKLMKGLSEDINGQAEITGKDGTRIHIAFPADPLTVSIV